MASASIKKSELARLLRIVGKREYRVTNPIEVSIGSGRLTLSSRFSTEALSLSSEVKSKGRAASSFVACRDLAKAVAATNAKELTIEVDSSGVKIIGESTLIVDSRKTTQAEPLNFRTKSRIRLSGEELLPALKVALTSAGSVGEMVRLAIGSVRMDVIDSQISYLVATDGHRIAVQEVNVKRMTASAESITIPREIAEDLASAVPSGDVFLTSGKLRTSAPEGKPIVVDIARFQWADGFIVFRPMCGVYPNWRPLLKPAKGRIRFPVNRDEVIEFCDQAIKLKCKLNGAPTCARMEFSGNLRLYTEYSGGSLSREIEPRVKWTAPEEALVIGINPSYLRDAVKNCGETVHLGVTHPHAVITVSDPSNKGLRQVVMPMSLGGSP